MKIPTTAALAVFAVLLTFTACAPLTVQTGGGDVTRLQADLRSCAGETFAFALIPDFGFTVDYQRAKCMKARGWIPAPGVNQYAWIGPGAVKQLVTFQNGDVAIQVLCPGTLTCQSVEPSPAPAEWTTWAFEAWGDSQFRRTELAIVGDEGRCEEVRQRDAAQGVPTGPCRGPLYFKRAGAPDALPVAAAPPAASPEPTWATGL